MLKETDWFGLLNTEYDLFGNLVCYTDVNLAYNIFETNFIRLYNSAFTVNKTIGHSCSYFKKRDNNNNQAPWITPDII